MIAIVDSGSTKADWIIIDDNGNSPYDVIKTKGLNPAVVAVEDLRAVIESQETLMSIKDNITQVHLYGAGCGTEKPKQALKLVLESIFTNAKVSVLEDTMAAVYATVNNPKEKAVVCILGTGSNCSYYNGEDVEQRVDSLGYSIMDDASGNYFGKQLLRDYYFNKMPSEIAKDFKNQYDVTADTIKFNLYKKAFPNAYLANFAHFMSRHETSDYVKLLLQKGVDLFIENMVFQFKDELQNNIPVHFVGSVALFSKAQIESAGAKYNFKVGNFEPKPIEGLVGFHLKYL